MALITTANPPEARPMGVSSALTTSKVAVVTVDNYSVPSNSWSSQTVTVPGVVEITSPAILCNKSSSTVTVNLFIYRTSNSTEYAVAYQIPVPANDTLAVPIQGQCLKTGDELRAQASVAASIDLSLSYTIGIEEQNDLA